MGVGQALVVEALPNKNLQTRINSVSGAKEQRVLGGHAILHNEGQLEMLLMEQTGEELKGKVLGNACDQLPCQEMLKGFPS